jgi:hypothetical protein
MVHQFVDHTLRQGSTALQKYLQPIRDSARHLAGAAVVVFGDGIAGKQQKKEREDAARKTGHLSCCQVATCSLLDYFIPIP